MSKENKLLLLLLLLLSTTCAMSKITQLDISRIRLNPKKKQGSSKLHIFTPFCQFWGQNSEYPLLQKFGNFFDISPIGT